MGRNPASKRKLANFGRRKTVKWSTRKPAGLSLQKSVPRLPLMFARTSIGKNASTRLMKSARLFQLRIARKKSSKNQDKSAFLCLLFALKKTGKENENIFMNCDFYTLYF